MVAYAWLVAVMHNLAARCVKFEGLFSHVFCLTDSCTCYASFVAQKWRQKNMRQKHIHTGAMS
ncbi:hypothetical protein CYJ33_05775 [Alloscardovia omnicolens]|uniref:Uncharacterized protein n=2 Tax=Alloscardovia omnicolens TaxID=419015 RepID=U1QWJ5_9BIFI|nr:hypothetical protein HMPREF9244_00192 [Alloscardovia omnicolens F0580]PKY78387.1 hypothetical protein CYJ33_05775 [Alloscardovia omnicolens]PKZ14868.1 hypothetical protein CYJ32_04975 [Alloscardovia omnicolens]